VNGASGQAVDADLAWTGGHTCQEEPVAYDVYLGTGGQATSLVCSGSATTCDPGDLLPGTTYAWKVVATSSGGSSESPLWTFGTEELPCSVPPAKPTDPLPAHGATGVALDADLAWCGGHPCEGEVVTYDVYLKKQGEVTDSLVCSQLDATTCDPGLLEEGTAYVWHVIANGLNGPTGGDEWTFSTTTCLVPPQVVLTTPEDGQTFRAGDQPVLSWQGDPDATAYELQIYQDASLATLVLETTTASTSVTLQRYATAGTYYWRVRATATDLGCSGTGAWSEVRSFVIEPLVLDHRILLPLTFRP